MYLRAFAQVRLLQLHEVAHSRSAPMRVSGRTWAKGPTEAPAPTAHSRSRQWSSTWAPAPTSASTRRAKGPTLAPARTTLRPSRIVNGRMTALGLDQDVQADRRGRRDPRSRRPAAMSACVRRRRSSAAGLGELGEGVDAAGPRPDRRRRTRSRGVPPRRAGARDPSGSTPPGRCRGSSARARRATPAPSKAYAPTLISLLSRPALRTSLASTISATPPSAPRTTRPYSPASSRRAGQQRGRAPWTARGRRGARAGSGTVAGADRRSRPAAYVPGCAAKRSRAACSAWPVPSGGSWRTKAARARERCLDGRCLVTDHDRHGLGACRRDRPQHVLQQRDAQDRMQHLGPPALHAGSLAGCEDDGLRGSRHGAHQEMLARGPCGPVPSSTPRRLADARGRGTRRPGGSLRSRRRCGPAPGWPDWRRSPNATP